MIGKGIASIKPDLLKKEEKNCNKSIAIRPKDQKKHLEKMPIPHIDKIFKCLEGMCM